VVGHGTSSTFWNDKATDVGGGIYNSAILTMGGTVSKARPAIR
jgi:hypothetical protein